MNESEKMKIYIGTNSNYNTNSYNNINNKDLLETLDDNQNNNINYNILNSNIKKSMNIIEMN